MRADEETQLNNFKAHRAKILDELKIAGAALTEVFENIGLAEAHLAEVTRKGNEAGENLASISIQVENKKKEADESVARRDAAEASLVKAKESAVAEYANIARCRTEANSEILKKSRESEKLDEQIKDKSIRLTTINESYAALCTNHSQREDEHHAWQRAAEEEKRVHTEELRLIKIERIAEEDLLLKTRAEIAEEIKKIEEPQKALAADFAKIAHMKRNVDIYAARVKRKHKELYPGRPFNIT